MLSVFRLHYIQDYRDAVFVVIADKTLICISCIGSYNAITFVATLGWFMIWYDNSCARGECKSCRLLLIFMYHRICVNDSQSSDLSRFTRLRIYFVLYIYTLPVLFEKFFQILLTTDEFLARASWWRPVCDLLLRQLVMLHSLCKYASRSSMMPTDLTTGTTFQIFIWTGLNLFTICIVFKVLGSCCASDFPLEGWHRLGIVIFTDVIWSHFVQMRHRAGLGNLLLFRGCLVSTIVLSVIRRRICTSFMFTV